MAKNLVQPGQVRPASWSQRYGTTLLIGAGLLLLPIIYFQYAEISWYPLNPVEHLIQHGLAYLFLVLFSYVNYTVFVPRWYLTNQYGRYAFIVIICLVCVVWFSHRLEQLVFLKPPKPPTVAGWVRQVWWAENMFSPPHERPLGTPPEFRSGQAQSLKMGDPPTAHSDPTSTDTRKKHRQGGPNRWLKLTLIFLLGGISSFVSITIKTANRLRQVEKNQLAAELRQLKVQIHPHFLYNMLNSIYALAIRKDDRAADMVVKLAELMRYMTSDAHRDSIPLQTETAYIANYIDLQKTRLQNTDCVQYELIGDVSRWQIAPLLLVSFIENAFKYGINPAEECRIIIRLTVQDGHLHVMASNRKVAISRFEKSLGIGLQNTQERLALLYPQKYTLLIDDTLTHYTVNLSLTLWI